MSHSFAQTFPIAGRVVGVGQPVFIIAEAGVNHNGDLDLAMHLVDAAAAAGADAVKFQTFRAEQIATRAAPKARYHIETTGTEQSWFDLLKSQELSRADHEAIMAHCDAVGITFLSTPYDGDSVQLLAELNVPAFKIASTDANNVPFLVQTAQSGRPMILSTAMCTWDEVQESVRAIASTGLRELIVLHCTGNYPAPVAETNMRAMATMGAALGVPVGYSNHTQEQVNPVLTVALGGCVYETHFTLDRNLPGPDHRMSLTPDELRQTVQAVRMAEEAMGSGEKAVQPCERDNREILRKSLVTTRSMKRGEPFSASTLAIKRPGNGLAPKWYNVLLERRAARDLAAEYVLTADDVEGGIS